MEPPRTSFKSKHVQPAGSIFLLHHSTIHNVGSHSTTTLSYIISNPPQHQPSISFFCRKPRVKWERERAELFILFLSVRKLGREKRDLLFSFLPSVSWWRDREPNFLHSSRKLEQGRGRASGLHFWTAERREIFPLLVACVELQAEVISGLRLVVYRLMKLFRGMHVRVVRLDDKLSLKKSDGEGIGVAECVSWKFAALVGQFVIIWV